MKFKNPLENKEFDKKFNNLKNTISEYINDKEYDLKSLTLEELIWWRDIGNNKIIETTEKCPKEIQGIITGFIKEEFPIETKK